MGKKHKHIPSSNPSSNEDWLKYLKHEMDEEEAHAFESNLLDNDFEWEAMEGLEAFENPEALDENLNSIKKNILKKVKTHKYPRRTIQLFGDLKWSILTLLIIIVIVVVAIFIINLMMH